MTRSSLKSDAAPPSAQLERRVVIASSSTSDFPDSGRSDVTTARLMRRSAVELVLPALDVFCFVGTSAAVLLLLLLLRRDVTTRGTRAGACRELLAPLL